MLNTFIYNSPPGRAAAGAPRDGPGQMAADFATFRPPGARAIKFEQSNERLPRALSKVMR